MNMRIMRIALLSFLILSVGCIRIEQTLTIKKDASGSCDIYYSMSEQTIVQLKAMLKLREQMAAASENISGLIQEDDFTRMLIDPIENDMRREIKKYEKYGITLERMKVESRNAWRHVRMKILFDNLEEAAKTDVFQEYGFSLSKNTNGNYLFYRKGENDDSKKTRKFSDHETVRLLTPLLGGFKVVLRLNTPGKILKTNAPQKSLYSAIWNFDFDKNPDAVLGLQNESLMLVFEGDGLNLPEIKTNR